MPIQLVKITAKRDGNKIGPEISREVIDELPDDPHYWDPLCEFLLDKMIRDGVIPDPSKPKEMTRGEG